jgi:hypothetical protein
VLDDPSQGHDGGYPASRKFQVPMMDENAPDLYIPLMAFITYILVTGYAKGTKNSFTPEVLVEVRLITHDLLRLQTNSIAVRLQQPFLETRLAISNSLLFSCARGGR